MIKCPKCGSDDVDPATIGFPDAFQCLECGFLFPEVLSLFPVLKPQGVKMPRILNLEVFEWTHPDMSVPLEVSIGFDYHWRYDAKTDRDYETIDPYIEAVYVGNVDIMPLISRGDLAQALKDYKESKR